MTPGTIVKAGNINLLVLYELKGYPRRPCTVLVDEPYVSHDGIIDIVKSGENHFYLVPGIAMLQPENLAQLQVIGKVDDDQLKAIAFRPEVAHQVHSIIRSESAQQGQGPDKGDSFSPDAND